MPFDFTGKKILVTGAGRGIGRDLAKSLVDAGGDVYALGKTKENIESLCKEYNSIHPIIVDLSDWDATRAAIERLEPLNGVVNNAAGSLTLVDAIDVKKETLEESLNVGVLAPINVIQVTSKKMIEGGIHGAIVNVSSIGSVSAFPRDIDHTVSKAALDMVTKQFALELGPHQLRVNSVNPSWVWTEGAKKELKKFPERERQITSITPLGRYCEIREVSESIMYLLSEHSSMVNGTIHIVDGGLLANIPVYL